MHRAQQGANDPLGTDSISRLLTDFAVPSIVAMLVYVLYNMVDQFFIGQKIGEFGNAATNVAFPLRTVCAALTLLLEGGSAFNLNMGKGEHEKAIYYR